MANHFTITVNSATSVSVSAQWSVPSGEGTGQGLPENNTLKVYFKPSSSSTWTLFKQSSASNGLKATLTTFTNNSMTANTTYNFKTISLL